MLYALILVVVVSTIGRISAQSFLDDACHLTPTWTGSTVEADTDPSWELEIPATCLEGDIDWHGPRGHLHVFTVRYNYTYSLCLEESWFTVLGGITELTGGVKHDMPLPTEGNPTCTQDVYGKTEFMVLAAEELLYMTTFKYRIISPQLENA